MLVFAAGCYPTTPHRAVAAAAAAPARCAQAIDSVFARSGFVELPAPPQLWKFFGPRTSGPYSSFLRTGTGVGVTLDAQAEKAGTCQVTIEAFSPDNAAPDQNAPLPDSCIDVTRYSGPGGRPLGRLYPGGYTHPDTAAPCPMVGSPMNMTSAPGGDNDAAVDELARRLQAELGPRARVN